MTKPCSYNDRRYHNNEKTTHTFISVALLLLGRTSQYTHAIYTLSKVDYSVICIDLVFLYFHCDPFPVFGHVGVYPGCYLTTQNTP